MIRAAVGAALALLASAGCTGEAVAPGGDGPDGAVDAPVDIADDGVVCPAPTAAPPWLDDYLRDQVARLTGAAELTPGVRLADRATAPARAAARTYLQGELTGLGLAVSLDSYGQGANVVGELAATGTDPVSWLILGAHFDSVTASPGANDNATGVATVLAVARALTALPCRARGVRFVMFDQEEIGLVGSSMYATRQFQARTPIVAVHTIDQLGWDADDDLRFEVELPAPGLLAEYQAAAAVVGAQVVATTTAGTDHTAFRERGFASVGLTEEYVSGDTTPHYHRPEDTAATVDRGYHAVATRLVTLVIARELGAD